MSLLNGASLEGYEIHMGRTEIGERLAGNPGAQRPDLSACRMALPAPDGRIWGCYLHGLFANTQVRHAWLTSLGWHDQTASAPDSDRSAMPPGVPGSFDRLADAFEAALDMPLLEKIIWES